MERPILFSGPMIRALLPGAKTQTRRILKAPYGWDPNTMDLQAVMEHPDCPKAQAFFGDGWGVGCPYGKRSDRLWVREMWRPVIERWSSYIEYAAGGPDLANSDRDRMTGLSKVALRFPGARADIHSEAWHPSIHMPRWASRINLAITGIKVERVQDISEADILAEGITVPLVAEMTGIPWSDIPDLFTAWRLAWVHINGPESWDANPYVWAISFKVVQPGGGGAEG